MGILKWLHERSIQKRFDDFAKEQERLSGEERKEQRRKDRERWLREGPCRCGSTEDIISKDLGDMQGLRPLCWRCDPYRGILDPRSWANWETYPYKHHIRTREEFEYVHGLSQRRGPVDVKISLTSDDGRSWDNLTEEEFEALSAKLDAERTEKETRARLEKITDIKTEVKNLLELRQQQQETEQRIEGLGYRISKNSPNEMYSGLRSKVFRKLGFELIATTPYPYSRPYDSRPDIEEWLLPIDEETEERIEAALAEEEERERFENKD
jgi:hypothetical protein